jgi:hypothetical protein
MSSYEQFLERVGRDEGDALEAESLILQSMPRDQLPAFARAVLDGSEPTPEYWRWLISQYR